MRSHLPDHASESDDRALPIDQVGIRGLSYPITVWDRSSKRQSTVAEISLSVGLPAHFKGTHMSRFIEVLEAHRGEVSLGTVPEILSEVQRRLEAHDAFLEVRFPYFLERSAPVSGVRSLMEYKSRFIAAKHGSELEFTLGVTVPVKTLCPCSKSISQYGAHNQRGLVDVEARFEGMLWIEDVVEAVEACASSPVYALLKREDEKWVTERAYENPRFVEDLVREVVLRLSAHPQVRWLKVVADNVESIHNHSAWAEIRWPAPTPVPAPLKTPAPPPSFGEWLRTTREGRRESQRTLAQRLGVSASVLSRVEGGARELPEPALLRLAEAWGLDPLRVQLRAGRLPDEARRKICNDPDGFLDWAKS